MIARLTGILAEKHPDNVILDVNGVGYRVFIPLTTFYKLGHTGSETTFSIHTQVREDAIHLFGFTDVIERKMFNLLIEVKGIGPKQALKLLSGMEAPALAQAIAAGSKTDLVKVPGLGKKTADRIILELRDKAAQLSAEEEIAEPGTPLVAFDDEDNDVVSALVNLGYKSAQAEQALSRVKKENPEIKGVESLLRQALKSISKSK